MELKEKLKGLRALVVEDDPAVGDILKRFMSFLGFAQADLAEDEPQALKFLDINIYGFILADTNYGCVGRKDHYGPRIVAHARKLGQTPKVGAMSGLNNNREVWSGESTPDFFLTKPFGMKNLKEALERVYLEKMYL